MRSWVAGLEARVLMLQAAVVLGSQKWKGGGGTMGFLREGGV
jgi:hypothetical protein